MNSGDQTETQIIHQLSSLFKSFDQELITSIWNETGKNINRTIEFLKDMGSNQFQSKEEHNSEENDYANNDDFFEEEEYDDEYYRDNREEEEVEEKSEVFEEKKVEYIPILQKANDLSFGDPCLTDEITDPDLKLVLELQREELENEQRRKKQEEEDAKFALELEKHHSGNEVTQGLGQNDIENMLQALENDLMNKRVYISNTKDQKGMEMVQKSTQPARKKTVTIIREEDDGLCVVCLNAERNAVFIPCAHRDCCAKCANQIFTLKKVCPLCWTDLEGVIERGLNDGNGR